MFFCSLIYLSPTIAPQLYATDVAWDDFKYLYDYTYKI